MTVRLEVAKHSMLLISKKTPSQNIMKSLQNSNVFRSIVFAVLLAGASIVGGCSTDAIMGPDQAEGPTAQTSTNPYDPQPGNDDCSVGGCRK